MFFSFLFALLLELFPLISPVFTGIVLLVRLFGFDFLFLSVVCGLVGLVSGGWLAVIMNEGLD